LVSGEYQGIIDFVRIPGSLDGGGFTRIGVA